MIRYRYKNARILFVGINPHPGSFNRSVPFSNNKMFWYLLSEAGLLKETRDELRNDESFEAHVQRDIQSRCISWGLSILSIDQLAISPKLEDGEEISGRRKIFRIIKAETPQGRLFYWQIGV